MSKILVAVAILATFVCGGAMATDNVANGLALYNGTAPGSYGCNQCHNVNDNTSAMNKAFRGAAGDPGLINFAINSDPDSSLQMGPLYGVAGNYALSDSDESDLAAYIYSVVYPSGGTPPAGATFASNPTSAGFGTVAVGAQSGTTTFTISNSGTSGTINSVSSSNNTEFLVTGGTCLGVPVTVAQNGNCTVQVAFAPTLTGSRSSTLTILDSGTPNPLTVALSGTGGASAPAQANLSVPSSVSFGSQPLSVQGAPTQVSVRNIGTATAIITSTTSSSSEFVVTSSTCNGALVAGNTCTISVAFDPAASGTRSGTLTVVSTGVGSPQSIALSGAGTGGGVTGSGTKVTVVEYYDATFNHYFITSNATEISLLGKPPFADWQPTGLTFNAYSPTNPPAGSVGICRFFNDHFLGTSTHFYAPHGFGCEQTITSFPDWTLEDPQLFFAYVPDTAGNCQAGTIPVYRLYNNGMGGAPNHRFTTSLTVRQTMINLGYTPEGNGIGVGMCVPQ